eukprot:403332962
MDWGEEIQEGRQPAEEQKRGRKGRNLYKKKVKLLTKMEHDPRLQYKKRQSCIFYYDPQNYGTICKFGKKCEYSHQWNQFKYQVKENEVQIDDKKEDALQLQNTLSNSESSTIDIESQLNVENQKKMTLTNDETNIALIVKQRKFMRNGYNRRNTKVCQKLDKLQLKTQCSNYSHCLRHIHSYEEVLNEAVVKFDQRKVQISNRVGQQIFKNLSWNITGLILDYLNQKTIMNKIRYINHETLYITSERINHLNIERYVQIKINLENFVPLLSHPIFVDGTFHAQMIQNDKIFINDLLSKLYHLPLYQQLKSLAIDVQQPNRPIFDFRANLKVCLKYLINLHKLQLPLAYNVLQSNDKIKYDPKNEQIDLESIQEASKLVLVIDVQRLGQFIDTPMHKMNVFQKIMKNPYAQRITDIKFKQGLNDKKSFDNQDKMLLFSKPLNYLTNLKILDLKNCYLDDNSLLLLVQQSICQTVEDLRLNKNLITNKSIFNIMISTQLRSLKHLDIRKNKISSLGYFQFNQVYKLQTLKVYDEIEMSEEDLSQFFRGDFVKQIEHLYLRFVGRRSLLLQADQLQNVHEYKMKSLYLQGIVFQERTVAELFPKLVNLETLKLQFCKISGVHNVDSFSQLFKLKKLTLINVSSLYDFMRMINSCKDLQKLVVEYKNKDLNSFEIKEIKLKKLISLKIRAWNHRENAYFDEFQELECFQNLLTLEIPCLKYDCCLNNNADILKILQLMNIISSKYKHFKNLDFLGIKALGFSSDEQLLDNTAYFRKYLPHQIQRIFQRDPNTIKLYDYGNLFKLKGLGLPLCDRIYNLICTSKQYFSDSKLRKIIFYSRKPTRDSYFQQEALQRLLPLNCEMKLVKCHQIYTTFTRVTTMLNQLDENGNPIIMGDEFEAMRGGFRGRGGRDFPERIRDYTHGRHAATHRNKGLKLRNGETYNPFYMFDDLLSVEYFEQLQIQQIIEDSNQERTGKSTFLADYFESLNTDRSQQQIPREYEPRRGGRGGLGLVMRQEPRALREDVPDGEDDFYRDMIRDQRPRRHHEEDAEIFQQQEFDQGTFMQINHSAVEEMERIAQSQNVMNSVQINTSTAYMPTDEWEEERMVSQMVMEESKEQHQEEIKRQQPVEMMRSSVMPSPKND